MYKKKLLPFAALIATILLTGCSSSQPVRHSSALPIEIENSLTLKKTNLDNINVSSYSLNEIIKHDKLSIGKALQKRDKQGHYEYNAFIAIDFRVENDKLLSLNRSKCYVGNCNKIYKTKEYQNFILEAKNRQDFIHANIINIASEFKKNEYELENWIKQIKSTESIVPVVKNSVIKDKNILKEVSKKAEWNDYSTLITKESLFVEYKNSKINSLNTFLENKVFGYFNPYQKIIYKYFIFKNKLSGRDSGLNRQGVSLSNINKLFLEYDIIQYYFLPKVFTANDSNISLQLTLNNDGTYKIKVTNLTNKFIELSSISLYLDDRIRNLNVNTQLPPKAISENFRYIPLPEGTTAYKEITNINQVRDFGAAVSYMANSKKETLYTEKKIRISK